MVCEAMAAARVPERSRWYEAFLQIKYVTTSYLVVFKLRELTFYSTIFLFFVPSLERLKYMAKKHFEVTARMAEYINVNYLITTSEKLYNLAAALPEVKASNIVLKRDSAIYPYLRNVPAALKSVFPRAEKAKGEKSETVMSDGPRPWQ
jgi:hypothetical protein